MGDFSTDEPFWSSDEDFWRAEVVVLESILVDSAVALRVLDEPNRGIFPDPFAGSVDVSSFSSSTSGLQEEGTDVFDGALSGEYAIEEDCESFSGDLSFLFLGGLIGGESWRYDSLSNLSPFFCLLTSL